jgi:hypothetical protein
MTLDDRLKKELTDGVYQDFCLPAFDKHEKQIRNIYEFLLANRPKADT